MVEGDDPAAVHDRDAIAELLRLLHVVGRQHDGVAPVAKRAHEAPQVAARLRVEAGGRLVEEQDARIVDERRRDAEALLLAAGQRSHLALRLLGQLDVGEQAHRVDVAPVQAAEQVEQLDEGELVEEGRRLELDADPPLHLARIGAPRRPHR